jgi:transcription elongation factor Elf1
MDYKGKLAFLEQLLGQAKYSISTKEAEFFCCFCNHHKKKLSINLETDNWKCWVCQKNGKRLYYVIKEVGARKDLDTYSRLYKSNTVVEKRPYQGQDFYLRLPKEYSPIVNCKDSVLGNRAFRYLTETRGVSESDILRYKLGVLTHGNHRGSVVIPSFDARGNLNWYSTRQIGGGGKLHPQVPTGYKNTIIPNDLNIDWTEPVVLVEGPFDMLKSIKNTIPLFGNWLSPKSLVFEQIVKNEVPVFLALDADAMQQAHRIAKNFIKHPVPLYNIAMHPYGDPGEHSKQEFRKKFESAGPLDRAEIIRQRLRDLC